MELTTDVIRRAFLPSSMEVSAAACQPHNGTRWLYCWSAVHAATPTMETIDVITPRSLAPPPKKQTLSNIMPPLRELPNLPIDYLKKHLCIVPLLKELPNLFVDDLKKCLSIVRMPLVPLRGRIQQPTTLPTMMTSHRQIR
jgi:hypothetical protein